MVFKNVKIDIGKLEIEADKGGNNEAYTRYKHIHEKDEPSGYKTL
jgi:hypothetical protein